MVTRKVTELLQAFSFLRQVYIQEYLLVQSNSLQIASSVVKRIALAFPVLRTERLAGVIPIRSASSPERIFFLASSTSKLTIIISPS